MYHFQIVSEGNKNDSRTFEGGCRTCQEYRTQGRPAIVKVFIIHSDRTQVQERSISPHKVSASTCRRFRTRRTCRTGRDPPPGHKISLLKLKELQENVFGDGELSLDINIRIKTNSPCTCQSLAYTPGCQHQQSLPSRSILAGEESSGKELFV